jgi:poly-gamma-glutamate synthesis protein (capsule biosynthesis protein)
MTGRGIDQILPHSVSPTLKERYVQDARRYLELAENKSGSIPKQASYEYIWGDALEVLNGLDADVRIINLETSLTTEHEFWAGKGVHYRMHPKNVDLLKTACIDICLLGNNHVMDFGHAGLQETLNTLEGAGIKTAGAGNSQSEASKPAVIQTNSGRLLAFSYGSPTAGVPSAWRATDDSRGINFLPDLSKESSTLVIRHIQRFKQEGDRVIVSIHWGSNWGYDIPAAQKNFAHRLIDSGGADLIHGHSSHHPKGIEVYKNRAIIYGAGDLLNDYEGIGGRPQYRDDLCLMYFPQLNARGELIALEMIPMHIKKFQLQYATKSETEFLADMMNRECKKLGTDIRLNEQGNLFLQWQA